MTAEHGGARFFPQGKPSEETPVLRAGWKSDDGSIPDQGIPGALLSAAPCQHPSKDQAQAKKPGMPQAASKCNSGCGLHKSIGAHKERGQKLFLTVIRPRLSPSREISL